MIKCEIDANGNERNVYVGPDSEALRQKHIAMLEHLEQLLSISGLNFENCTIDVDDKLFGDLFVRVSKRFDYYRIFHKDTYLNEVREAAIEAYWIMRFKPIRVIECAPYEGESFEHINESFALFLIFSVIKEQRRRLGQPDFAVDKNCLQQLIYATRYWDLSKEALMIIAVALDTVTVADDELERLVKVG